MESILGVRATPHAAAKPAFMRAAADLHGRLLSLALAPLIDHAIDKGDDVLRQRLEQLDGIIKGAIANINAVLKERLQDADEKVRRQRLETVRDLDRLGGEVNGMLQVSFDRLDATLQTNIDGLQNAFGNDIASLPIPTEPLVIVGRDNALSVIGTVEGPSRLFISGSGLFKGGEKPEAFIMTGTGKPKQIPVSTASMGLLALDIPRDLLPDGNTPVTYTLELSIYKGLFSKRAHPTFPLTVCGSLPIFDVKAALKATDGVGWTRSQTGPRWFYRDSQPAYTIKAADLVPKDWEVDTSRFHSGLEIVDVPSGAGEHNERWVTDGYELWVGGHGGNNSHATAIAAIKQRKPMPVCGVDEKTSSLGYSGLNQIALSPTKARGECDVAVAKPEMIATVTLLRKGSIVETVNVSVPSKNVRFLDGQATMAIDEQGLLGIALKPLCRASTRFATSR